MSMCIPAGSCLAMAFPLLLHQAFFEHLIFGYRLTDILLAALSFLQEIGFDQALSGLFPVGIQSLDVVFDSVYYEELLDLHISSSDVLLWPIHYTGRYLMTGRAYVLMACILLLSLSWVIRICLIFWWHLDVAVFLAFSL